jgi:hypothetical protein
MYSKRLTILLILIHLFLEQTSHSWKDSRSLNRFHIDISKTAVHTIIVNTGSLHRESLARPSLSVSKNAHIESIEGCLHKWFDLIENVLLTRVWQKHMVEVEQVVLPLLWVEQLQSVVLCVVLIVQNLGVRDH